MNVKEMVFIVIIIFIIIFVDQSMQRLLEEARMQLSSTGLQLKQLSLSHDQQIQKVGLVLVCITQTRHYSWTFIKAKISNVVIYHFCS